MAVANTTNLEIFPGDGGTFLFTTDCFRRGLAMKDVVLEQVATLRLRTQSVTTYIDVTL